MAKTRGLPDREQIIKRMWRLVSARAGDAVKLACFPPEGWQDTEKLDLDALTEFKRGSNGVVELKFVDRGRLLERLLDAVDHSGEDQVDRFLQAMEEQGG
ncbi:XRE family transcriptional regulator [Pseudoflavonifractor sp. 60]|uniref:XRE family transcriptional regulator n=1 Tax=Pseudoflavonifractor sp. 60 TaxID=2304576 RepID=UPI00136A5ABF|nr:XRE family transcriptional regulator [Pseudoflavonifractor sp. 60]NBI68475.1 XRE family transcriptional regulator [Pseudoflavonifractor sp. 60]